MPITTLRVTDFRNLSQVDLTFHLRGMNVICGINGSGKTSLLEAIHYLGLGRSFRSANATQLIQHTAQKFSICAQLVNASAQSIPIGVERDASGMSRARVAERDIASMAELASFLPIRLINSQSHHLFESGPHFRRKYLDWGLFYQTDKFLLCWRQFERILKQRNIVLRDKRPKRELDAWTDELIKYGTELDHLRRDYIKILTPLIIDISQELLGPLPQLAISYSPGWDQEQDYATVLRQHYADEMRLGCTQFGPHRADLDITIDTVSVKHFLSRGQQKLLICAMIIAQGMLAGQEHQGLIYLVDDLPSELDRHSRQKLISLLSQQPTQIFITAIESNAICELVSEQSDILMKVFHVEHGKVIELNL